MKCCAWADSAIKKQGEEFILAKGDVSVSAELANAEFQQLPAGFTGYTFGWRAAESEERPVGDGHYRVSGDGLKETELFVVWSQTSGLDFWTAQVTCENSGQSSD